MPMTMGESIAAIFESAVMMTDVLKKSAAMNITAADASMM
jgi:hypothetical protein